MENDKKSSRVTRSKAKKLGKSSKKKSKSDKSRKHSRSEKDSVMKKVPKKSSKVPAPSRPSKVKSIAEFTKEVSQIETDFWREIEYPGWIHFDPEQPFDHSGLSKEFLEFSATGVMAEPWNYNSTQYHSYHIIDLFVVWASALGIAKKTQKNVLKLVGRFKSREEFVSNVLAAFSDSKQNPPHGIDDVGSAMFALAGVDAAYLKSLRSRISVLERKVSDIDPEIIAFEKEVIGIHQLLKKEDKKLRDIAEKARDVYKMKISAVDKYRENTQSIRNFISDFNQRKSGQLDISVIAKLRTTYDSNSDLQTKFTFDQFKRLYMMGTRNSRFKGQINKLRSDPSFKLGQELVAASKSDKDEDANESEDSSSEEGDSELDEDVLQHLQE